jgi:hypothetical protein
MQGTKRPNYSETDCLMHSCIGMSFLCSRAIPTLSVVAWNPYSPLLAWKRIGRFHRRRLEAETSRGNSLLVEINSLFVSAGNRSLGRRQDWEILDLRPWDDPVPPFLQPVDADVPLLEQASQLPVGGSGLEERNLGEEVVDEVVLHPQREDRADG